jgi:hypothetical protein
MRLYRFGPWDLTRAHEVREAAAILLAIAKYWKRIVLLTVSRVAGCVCGGDQSEHGSN